MDIYTCIIACMTCLGFILDSLVLVMITVNESNNNRFISSGCLFQISEKVKSNSLKSTSCTDSVANAG